MDMHAVLAHENAFDHPLDDIAADDRRDDQSLIDRLERIAVIIEALGPGPPPERRVDEVEAVVEDIAPFRRLAGAARELAVDRVEHHEAETGSYTLPILALHPEPEGRDAENGA